MSVRRSINTIAREKNLKLVVMPTSLTVRSDPNLLRRLVQNLVSNAIKYTPSGRVLVGARRHGKEVVITQKDIRQVQLAKAAIHAGVCLLQERFGSPFRRVLLAGACGNYMDPQDALAIGLLPENQGARIVAVGNAAGHGACLALLDTRQRRRAERVAREMEYQELSGLERFSELFLSGMAFPPARDVPGSVTPPP